MILGIIFSLFGIGFLIAVVLNMAVFALPVFVAASAGRIAFQSGAGMAGSIVVGLAAGVAAFLAGRAIATRGRSSIARIAVILAFTAPAAFAGYHVVLGLSRIGGVHGLWQPIFAAAGAAVIGLVALTRLLNPLVPAPLLIGAPQSRPLGNPRRFGA